MEVGLVKSVDIDHEMQQAYLDYAMSVIVARALPDARDGLKPVHRRILYAMYDMGLRPDSPFKKSARIVGEVLGKYHPHGDQAVYEAMARLAQDFSMRHTLVDGQGNFGSVDGDPPAAMRYTEARLTAAAMHMLVDIRKNTVNFSDNFDGSLTAPDVLPAAIPNLLVNGATGIAVGMSTNIPPHNLGEVTDALIFMLENWEKLDDINVEHLMHFIQGPDFPTGGLIIQSNGEDDLKAAYGTGRGKVTIQARAHFEEMSRGRNRIIITELPYMTNKSSLIERIAELAREGRLEGLADLRDESDRHGLRIVIELTKNAEPEQVLKDLFKSTPLRTTFGIIMLALVDGEPRMLSLKQALRVYLDHRQEVIRRRGEYDLEHLRARAHILEGLRVALKNLDEVINIIRRANDADAARDRLMKRFKLTEIQAQAILDMPLRRLAALERKKIEDEYKEVLAEIKKLEALLKSAVKIRQVVADELKAVKEAFSDRRRTQIVHLKPGAEISALPLTTTDLAPDKVTWISVTADGLISRSLDEKPPRQSGSGAPMWLIQASTRDTVYLVSTQGETAAIPVHALPDVENLQEGILFHKVSPLADKDVLAAVFTLPKSEERVENGFVLTATRQGMVKKSVLSELPGPSAHTFTLTRVNEDDRLGWVRLTNGTNEILLVTADGMTIRFTEDEVRPMGLVAAGVGGIKLGARDELVGMELIPSRGEILLVASDGKAKRLPTDQFPRQGRYGQGVIAWKLPRTTQLAGVAAGKGTLRLTLHLEKLTPKAIRLDEAVLQTRAAQGKPVVEIKSGDRVTALTAPWEMPKSKTGKLTIDEDGEDTPKPSRSQKEIAPLKQASFENLVEESKLKTVAQRVIPAKPAKAAVKPKATPKSKEKLASSKSSPSPSAGKADRRDAISRVSIAKTAPKSEPPAKPVKSAAHPKATVGSQSKPAPAKASPPAKASKGTGRKAAAKPTVETQYLASLSPTAKPAKPGKKTVSKSTKAAPAGEKSHPAAPAATRKKPTPAAKKPPAAKPTTPRSQTAKKPAAKTTAKPNKKSTRSSQ